jgi:hypothetical protein
MNIKLSFLSMRFILTITLIISTFFLSGCDTLFAPAHQPHIVNQIPQRAQHIANQTVGLSPQIVALALKAYNKAQLQGYGEKHILTIINYSRASTNNRFWVINLDSNKVLFRELVSHGIGSGDLYATKFSDTVNSRETSLGMYMTAKDGYKGRHGYALRLYGLEPGFNGNAHARAIVIHGAPYLCPAFIKEHGIAGRSWGCPALDPKQLKQIINTIRGNTLVFAYGNDPKWLKRSKFLN